MQWECNILKRMFFEHLTFLAGKEWEFLHDNASSKRRNNDPSKKETWGRKSIVSPEKIRKIKRILKTEGIEA